MPLGDHSGVFGTIWKGLEGEPGAASALVRLSAPVCCPWVCPEVRTPDDYPEDTFQRPPEQGQLELVTFP